LVRNRFGIKYSNDRRISHRLLCDPSWQLRHALGHKVEINPKAYTRKLKHPEEDETEQSDE